MLRRFMVVVLLIAGTMGTLTVAAVEAVPASAAPADRAATGTIATRTLTNPAGTRAYQVYRPKEAVPGAPLVVWLHGASKVKDGDPQELQRRSSLLREADRRGYSVVAPMQSLAADATGTWKVADPANMTRGGGESSIIADIVRRAVRDLHADPVRVYLVGHSAGAAMTANVAALYPELFAAIAMVAGFGYLGDPTGLALRTARGAHTTMPTYVVMGTRDAVIPPIFGDFATSASVAANGIAGSAPRSTVTVPAAGADRYPTIVRSYGVGRTAVTYASVVGADHPTGPGGLTVNGPALDRQVIDFLLTKRRG